MCPVFSSWCRLLQGHLRLCPQPSLAERLCFCMGIAEIARTCLSPSQPPETCPPATTKRPQGAPLPSTLEQSFLGYRGHSYHRGQGARRRKKFNAGLPPGDDHPQAGWGRSRACPRAFFPTVCWEPMLETAWLLFSVYAESRLSCLSHLRTRRQEVAKNAAWKPSDRFASLL